MKRTQTDIEDLPGWRPLNWPVTLENIRRMRMYANAPVDTMGCDRLADEEADPKTYRLQILVSLMLSAQTKDEVTASAMGRLIAGGFANLRGLFELPEQKLADLVYPVSFYKTKAKNIKRVCELLASDHDGDIPDSLEGLLNLPGVGPKMAHLAMNSAWHVVSGIGVDTHVHRISNRIGWLRKPTKTPEDTRVALQSWLPRDLWSEVNQLLVGFGQQTCLPVNPKCSSCANAPICPSARRQPQKRDALKEKSAKMVNRDKGGMTRRPQIDTIAAPSTPKQIRGTNAGGAREKEAILELSRGYALRARVLRKDGIEKTKIT